MVRCPPTSIEATLDRLLQRRHDPLWGWPAQARTECRALIRRVDEALLTLPELTQRIVACHFDERRSEATTALHLDLSRDEVREHLRRVYRTLARALGLATQPKPKRSQEVPS